ncbi:MBOAT family O-acyltransferase [Clostridium sporogenes]|uniref:MBOAT family O-acyltransferase n=1 Tax=Clostridium sporogenes TaxID=1509 RepID=UPI0030B7F58A
MLVGIILNLVLLFYYKYYDFAIGNINRISNNTFQYKCIILPIGISFFTFQGMSYIIDIYRKDAKVNKNILSVALYISFFPQLIAGPIVKYKDIDNQIRKRKETMEYFSYGIERFVIGLSKKVIIADTVAEIADTIFSLSNVGIDQPTAWLGAICYTFQIYFDFSGYSDMAIGLGYMFGFKFMENFNYPYISKSITEFWRRWHISLSTWFKEYLYIPLGGNRKGNTYLNLFIVFFTTGLWHGASWNFIAWGMWNGIFIIIEKIINKKILYIKTPSFIKTTITMSIVILGWVLFRANGLMDAVNYLSIMFGINKTTTVTYQFSYFVNKKLVFWMIISIIGSTPIIGNILKLYENKKIFQILKTIFIGILLIISIIFIVNSTYSPFIYFQF